jgi:hypothetical protein
VKIIASNPEDQRAADVMTRILECYFKEFPEEEKKIYEEAMQKTIQITIEGQ